VSYESIDVPVTVAVAASTSNIMPSEILSISLCFLQSLSHTRAHAYTLSLSVALSLLHTRITHIYTHTHAGARTHIYTRTHTYAHTHIYICKDEFIDIYLYMYIYSYTHVFMYTCILLCIYVCNCVCVNNIYTYIRYIIYEKQAEGVTNAHCIPWASTPST